MARSEHMFLTMFLDVGAIFSETLAFQFIFISFDKQRTTRNFRNLLFLSMTPF